MTAKQVEKRLSDLGFAYDEAVTHKAERWFGTIDPIGKTSIAGECRGVTVSGDSREEMDAEAVEQARRYRPFLQPCTNPNCEMHWDNAE